MDILKELQLFDDAPNDGEINTLLGQRTLTLHLSKSTEDLHSLEDRHSLDIYRASFPTSTVFTGVPTTVLSGDSHGGIIRTAGVPFTTAVPDVDLSSVSHEMPMCLLQEDEGNEEELIRLLSGQGGREWLLQAAMAACADQGGLSVESANKDSAGVTWCSEAEEEGLLGDPSMMLPDDLRLLVGAPAFGPLDFHHFQEPAGDMAPSQGGVDEHSKSKLPTSVRKEAKQEANIQDQLLQELAQHISGSSCAITRNTMTTSVTAECELSAVLEATGVPMFPSPRASASPQASNRQTTADMQQYATSSFCAPPPPSPPPSIPLMSLQSSSPPLHLSMNHKSAQQPMTGCAPQTSALSQTATLPQDLAGTVNLLNDILAAAVALCTSSAQSTEPVQSIHAASQAEPSETSRCIQSRETSRCIQSHETSRCIQSRETSRCIQSHETSRCIQSHETSRCIQSHVEEVTGGHTSLAPSRQTGSASLTSSRRAGATSLTSLRQTSVTGLTASRQTTGTSLMPLQSTTVAGSVPSRQTRPTSIASVGTKVGSVSASRSSLSARELASDGVELNNSPTVQDVPSSSSPATLGTSHSSPPTPSPLLDHAHTIPTHRNCATVSRGRGVSSSAPSTPIPPTTKEDGLPSVGGLVSGCSGGRGISLCFPMVDWTSRRVLQDRVVPMSATPIKLLLSEPQTPPGEDIMTDSEPKPKRKHSGGWRKGKKRKTACLLPPKPPVTAYGIFLSEHRTKLTEELGTLSMSSLSKQLGVMWSALDDIRKLEYRKKADVDKQRYLRELKVYLREVHQATAEDDMGTLELFVSENVTQEEDDDLLFCQICKLTFASLHNKKTHYSGKLHMEALLQCIKEAMANRAENQTTAMPDALQAADLESQSGNCGTDSSRSDRQKGHLNDNLSDLGNGSDNRFEGANADIDCSSIQHGTSGGTMGGDGGGQTAGLGCRPQENDKATTDPVTGDMMIAHMERGPVDNGTNGPNKPSMCSQSGGISLNSRDAMEEDEVVMSACEGGQEGCEVIDLRREQTNATGTRTVHRYPGRRCRPNKRSDRDGRPRSIGVQQSATCLSQLSPVSGQSVSQQPTPCVDARQALDGVASEQGAVGCTGLYSTISKQMADFAITYSCCVKTKNGGNESTSPGYTHNNNLMALRERATRLKDSITSLLEMLENVQ